MDMHYSTWYVYAVFCELLVGIPSAWCVVRVPRRHVYTRGKTLLVYTFALPAHVPAQPAECICGKRNPTSNMQLRFLEQCDRIGIGETHERWI